MSKPLSAAARKVLICLCVCILGMEAAAQGARSVVESRPFVPGQVNSQTGASVANNDAMSMLLDQIQQLQTEVQALRGMIEEQVFDLSRLQKDSLNRYSNIDQRLSSLESGSALTPLSSSTTSATDSIGTPNSIGTASGSIQSSNPLIDGAAIDAEPPIVSTSDLTNSNNIVQGITPVGISSAPVESDVSNSAALGAVTSVSPSSRDTGRGSLPPVVLSEQQLYQMAYDSVINSNFERSVAEFDQYLSVYPQGRFVTNAHYWKGQAYLYLNRYAEARDAYEIIISQHADSPKLPDAMYGLGLAYQGLGDIPQAKRLLTDIKRQFPNTGVANLADTRLLSLE